MSIKYELFTDLMVFKDIASLKEWYDEDVLNLSPQCSTYGVKSEDEAFVSRIIDGMCGGDESNLFSDCIDRQRETCKILRFNTAVSILLTFECWLALYGAPKKLDLDISKCRADFGKGQYSGKSSAPEEAFIHTEKRFFLQQNEVLYFYTPLCNCLMNDIKYSENENMSSSLYNDLRKLENAISQCVSDLRNFSDEGNEKAYETCKKSNTESQHDRRLKTAYYSFYANVKNMFYETFPDGQYENLSLEMKYTIELIFHFRALLRLQSELNEAGKAATNFMPTCDFFCCSVQLPIVFGIEHLYLNRVTVDTVIFYRHMVKDIAACIFHKAQILYDKEKCSDRKSEKADVSSKEESPIKSEDKEALKKACKRLNEYLNLPVFKELREDALEKMPDIAWEGQNRNTNPFNYGANHGQVIQLMATVCDAYKSRNYFAYTYAGCSPIFTALDFTEPSDPDDMIRAKYYEKEDKE